MNIECSPVLMSVVVIVLLLLKIHEILHLKYQDMPLKY